MPIQTIVILASHTADSQTERYLVLCLGEQDNLAHAEALQCIVCNCKSSSAVVESWLGQ